LRIKANININMLKKLKGNIYDFRALGCAVVAYTMVAKGNADAYITNYTYYYLTSMTELIDILGKVEDALSKQYSELIEYHNNETLRGVAKEQSLSILDNGHGNRGLYFSSIGFVANVPKCLEPGNAWEDGRYEDIQYLFEIKDNQLVVDTHQGKFGLLELFPTLNAESIEKKLKEEIAKLPLYKSIVSDQ